MASLCTTFRLGVVLFAAGLLTAISTADINPAPKQECQFGDSWTVACNQLQTCAGTYGSSCNFCIGPIHNGQRKKCFDVIYDSTCSRGTFDCKTCGAKYRGICQDGFCHAGATGNNCQDACSECQ